jgi:hypothetical protein
VLTGVQAVRGTNTNCNYQVIITYRVMTPALMYDGDRMIPTICYATAAPSAAIVAFGPARSKVKTLPARRGVRRLGCHTARLMVVQCTPLTARSCPGVPRLYSP